jgi:hypothetical protein
VKQSAGVVQQQNIGVSFMAPPRRSQVTSPAPRSKQPQPKKLTSKRHRETARHMRNEQWAFADRVAELGTVWLCWWNKNRHHDTTKDGALPDDLRVSGLIDGMELLEWLNSHKDWWVIGEWSDERYAAPVSLTPAGRAALANRELYDLEPVTGGLVEPGWICVPAPAGSAP